MNPYADTIERALTRMLTPLVRVLLRHGVSHGVLSELAKRVYVRVADQDFRIDGRRQTTARIAVLTGLNRKEVARLRRSSPSAESGDFLAARYNRAARVISGWLQDERFQDGSGRPAPLSFDGEAGFEALVRAYSGDMPARIVLEELEHVGAVERGDDGRIRLLKAGYVPSADIEQMLHILGTDVRDLIITIDHNLSCEPGAVRFQRKVAYDNIPREFVGAFHALVEERGQSLLEELDRWLAARDRDRTANVGGSGRMRLGVGINLVEEPAEHTGSEGERGP